MTRISIVTPSLNQAAYIEQTLRSVLEQEYADIVSSIGDESSQSEALRD